MIDKKNTLILFVILFFATLSLIVAFIVEYGLGHEPCKLCIYQRYPYLVSIVLLLSILIFKKNIKIHLILLSIVSLIGGTIAFYHLGIEQGFFNESVVCETQNINGNLSKEDILKQLKKNTVSCKEVTFRVFGLSLASINVVFSFALSYIFIKMYKNYEINK